MKKFFIPLIALISLSVSCKKSSSSSPSYSFSATVAGTAKNFNAAPPVATTTTVGGVTSITITGVLSASTGESIILLLDNSNGGGPIVARTYADTSTVFDMSATYFVNLSTQFEAGSSVESLAAGASIPITNHFKLVITSINSTAIQGTFTGDFFSNGDPTAAVKTITNGAFYAQFQ